MDALEQLITQNTNDFDVHEMPNNKLWENISAQLDDNTIQLDNAVNEHTKNKYRVLPFKWLAIAAMLVVAIGVGMITQANWQQVSITGFGHLQEIDHYYQEIIQAKLISIEKNPQFNDYEKQSLLQELASLDSDYTQLKHELAYHVNNEELTHAIIQNYRQRIWLLEQLINRLPREEENVHYDRQKTYL